MIKRFTKISAHTPRALQSLLAAMGATASFPDRKHAERALWERMSSLDEACDALDARSATASEARARRRLFNGARSVYHGLRVAHSASEALDNALAALSARR